MAPLAAQKPASFFVGAGLGVASLDADGFERQTGPIGAAFIGYRPARAIAVAIEGSRFWRSSSGVTYRLTRFGGVLRLYYPGLEWIHAKAGVSHSEYSVEFSDGTVPDDGLGILLGVGASYPLSRRLRLEPAIEWARHDSSANDRGAEMIGIGVSLTVLLGGPP